MVVTSGSIGLPAITSSIATIVLLRLVGNVVIVPLGGILAVVLNITITPIRVEFLTVFVVTKVMIVPPVWVVGNRGIGANVKVA